MVTPSALGPGVPRVPLMAPADSSGEVVVSAVPWSWPGGTEDTWDPRTEAERGTCTPAGRH
jgi:hypothetical protein